MCAGAPRPDRGPSINPGRRVGASGPRHRADQLGFDSDLRRPLAMSSSTRTVLPCLLRRTMTDLILGAGLTTAQRGNTHWLQGRAQPTLPPGHTGDVWAQLWSSQLGRCPAANSAPNVRSARGTDPRPPQQGTPKRNVAQYCLLPTHQNSATLSWPSPLAGLTALGSRTKANPPCSHGP